MGRGTGTGTLESTRSEVGHLFAIPKPHHCGILPVNRTLHISSRTFNGDMKYCDYCPKCNVYICQGRDLSEKEYCELVGKLIDENNERRRTKA